MTTLNFSVMEILLQLWAFIFGTKNGSDVVHKISLSTVSTEKRQKREKEHSQSSTFQAKWCQLHAAGKWKKPLQHRGWLDYKSFLPHVVKESWPRHVVPETGRQEPRRLASISQDQIRWLPAMIFVFGQKDCNWSSKFKKTKHFLPAFLP